MEKSSKSTRFCDKQEKKLFNMQYYFEVTTRYHTNSLEANCSWLTQI